MIRRLALVLAALAVATVAAAQTMLLSGVGPEGVSVPPPDAVVTFTDGNAGGSTAGMTESWTVNGGVRTGNWFIGIAADDSSGTNANPSGVTLNGTALVLASGLASGRSTASVWHSSAPIITTGVDTIVATWAANTETGSDYAALYAVDNLLSVISTANATSLSSPGALSMNVSAGGVVVGVTINRNTTTPVWSGFSASGGDLSKTSGTQRLSFAHNAFAAAQSPAALSVTTGGTTSTASVAAAWR